jgi:hypothetical protein
MYCVQSWGGGGAELLWCVHTLFLQVYSVVIQLWLDSPAAAGVVWLCTSR